MVLKYTLLAFSLMSSSNTSSMSLEFARSSIQSVLNQSSDTDALIETAPLYSLFYLQDIVNFACACATFTIDDKPLTFIQLPSIHLLASICLLYLKYSDTDPSLALTDPLHHKEMFLDQFISQIVTPLQ